MKLLRKRNTKQVVKTKPSAATTTAPLSPPKTAAAVPSLVEWQVADYNRRFGSNTNNNKNDQKKENTNTTSASSSPAAAADAVLEVSPSANAEDVKNLLESLQAVDSASVADTSYTSAALTRNTTYTSVATNALTQTPSCVTSTAGISVFQDMESYATSYDSNDRLPNDGSTEVSLASTSYAEQHELTMPGDDSWNSDWKEIFTLYDEKNDGTIDPKDFGTVYRALGQNPSEKEIATIVKELSPGGERIAFSAFEKAAKENMATPIDAETLADLFKVMDPDGTGVVSTSELTELLTTLSEPLEKPKAIALLAKYGKEVKYADFIADLLRPI